MPPLGVTLCQMTYKLHAGIVESIIITYVKVGFLHHTMLECVIYETILLN